MLIHQCEVCDTSGLTPFLDLGAQPMCDDLVPLGSDATPIAYPLVLAVCPVCLTVHQQYQIEKKVLFPRSYHYRAAMTQDVLAGMSELVAVVEGVLGGLSGKQVLDVGCNDGSLLALFKARGADTVGVEPTGAADDARPRVDKLINGFFDADAVDAYLGENRAPDVITFTNVFAHIEDLNGLIFNVKKLMTPKTKVVIENHYLGAVIERNQFDTFYHEHPRTYSCRSFEHIARKLGRSIERLEFPSRYNGNIRVILGEERGDVPTVDEGGFLTALMGMQSRVDVASKAARARLEELAFRYGPLPAKAFPGRAAILLHCFGVTADLVDATYERSRSPKIGHYVPGTRIEIRDEAEFFASRIDAPALVNFAWHINVEIVRYMRDHGYSGLVVPLFQ
jgi:SAM-dependent methyltransferase